jgi:hypothetical protein
MVGRADVSRVAEDIVRIHGGPGSSPDPLLGGDLESDLDGQRRPLSRITVALRIFSTLKIRCRCAPGRLYVVIGLKDANANASHSAAPPAVYVNRQTMPRVEQ